MKNKGADDVDDADAKKQLESAPEKQAGVRRLRSARLIDLKRPRRAAQIVWAETRVYFSRGLEAVMAEILRDLRHWHASLRHPDGGAVPQDVRRYILQPRPLDSPGERLLDVEHRLAGELDDVMRHRDLLGNDQRSLCSRRHRQHIFSINIMKPLALESNLVFSSSL